MSILDRIRNLFAPAPAPAPRAMAAAPATPSVPIVRKPAPEPPPPPESPVARRTLDRHGQDIVALEGPMNADISINLAECRSLKRLPDGIVTGTLTLSDCTALEVLPAGLSVAFLDLAGCTALRSLPEDLRLRGGRLNLRDCAQLTGLPDGLGEVAQLDLSGCLNIQDLPAGLAVTSWIDVGNSGIRTLPARFDHVGVRWNGVAVARRVAFAPETLGHEEILAERNAEVRRVMIERFGYERLLERAEAEELDRDTDAGGERRLLRIEMPGDEALVCVSVRCPSTGHHFVLRVPPDMTSCHQAVAWTAGYDDPAQYKPVVES